MQCLFHRQAQPQQQCVVAGHAEQAQADHQHAGDRTAAERNVHRRTDAMARGLCGAYVGAHRHVHADVARCAGQHRTDREADRGVPAQEDADQHEQHHAGDADGQVLAVEVGARAFLDGRGDGDHAFIAGGLAQDPARRDDSVQDRENGAAQRQ
ncbi:hypothetical protein D3C73_820150 [compost metagenome]